MVQPNSSYWEKRANARLSSAEAESEKTIARIKKAYDKGHRNIQNEIDAIYRTYGKKTGLDRATLETLLSKSDTDKYWQTMEGKGLKEYVHKNYKARITRLEQLQGQLYARSKEIAKQEHELSTDGYRNTVNQTYNYTMYDTARGTGFDFGFNTLDNRGIDAIVGHNWSGKHYSERIWKNTDILAEGLSEVLSGAMMSGQSKEKTAREIRDLMGVSKYQAERLVRTETNYFNNEAEAVAYEELEVEQYVYVATLDKRTSELCQEHDQVRYNLKDRKVGRNYPPLHPNCRSTVRAYLGEGYEPLRRRARDPITGKTYLIDNMSYKEWADGHGVKEVVKVPDSNKPFAPPPLPPKEQWRDFTKDARKMSLSGIDKEYQGTVKGYFNEIYNRYPIDISTLDVGTFKYKAPKGAPNSITTGYVRYGVSSKRDKGTGLQKLFYNDEYRLEKTVHQNADITKSLYRGQWGDNYQKSNTEATTIFHEYAHLIDQRYIVKSGKYDEFIKNIPEYLTTREQVNQINSFNRVFSTNSPERLSNQVNERLKARMSELIPNYTNEKHMEQIETSFGKYATTNTAEFFAEGVTTTLVVDPSKQDVFTQEFSKIFNELFDDRFRR